MLFCIYLSTASLRARFRDFHMMSVTNNPLDEQEHLKLTTQRAGTKTNNSSQTNLWTPRSFVCFVSRGRIRISTSRCPEVGLEFQLHAVFGAEGELIPGVTPLPESRATARRREENVFGVLDFMGWASRGEGEI